MSQKMRFLAAADSEGEPGMVKTCVGRHVPRLQRLLPLWARVFPQGAHSEQHLLGPTWVASTASQLPAQGPGGCSAHRGTDVAI